MPDDDCPLCGGELRHAFTVGDRNRGIGAGTFRYARCSTCRSYTLRNIPADLDAYYPASYFEFPSLDELRRHAATEAYRLRFVTPFAAGGRLVEVGPGNGIFAVQAKDAGFETCVLEMSGRAVAHLHEVVGVAAVQSANPEEQLSRLPRSRVVVGWHVLEHLSNPFDLVAAAAQNLEPDGVLVLATPNPRSLGFRVLGRRWPHVDAPRHLYLIDHEALVAQADRCGLELIGLTDTDQGGRHWNAFTWHYLLRGAHAGYYRDGFAHRAGSAIARVMGPIERRGMRGAAYTAVFRKR